MNSLEAYISLFISSFLSSTILPGHSEITLTTFILLEKYSQQVKNIHNKGIEVAIVIGGGNIYRGIEAEKSGINRVQGDYMGMMATLINSMALQSHLEKLGCDTRLMSGFNVHQVCEPFIRRKAIRHLEKRRIVIFGAGLGKPYFTTDSTASLRAIEIEANIVLKGTRVDGVYDNDPEKVKDAKKFKEISFNEVYEKNFLLSQKSIANFQEFLVINKKQSKK